MSTFPTEVFSPTGIWRSVIGICNGQALDFPWLLFFFFPSCCTLIHSGYNWLSNIMKSKSEINYLPENKQNSTTKKEKESSKFLFYIHCIFLYVQWRLLVIMLLSIECTIFWCTWTWIIHELVPPPTSYNNKTTLTFSRSLLEYYKKSRTLLCLSVRYWSNNNTLRSCEI